MRHNLNIEPIAMKKNNEKLSSIEENPKKERKKRWAIARYQPLIVNEIEQ